MSYGSVAVILLEDDPRRDPRLGVAGEAAGVDVAARVLRVDPGDGTRPRERPGQRDPPVDLRAVAARLAGVPEERFAPETVSNGTIRSFTWMR